MRKLLLTATLSLSMAVSVGAPAFAASSSTPTPTPTPAKSAEAAPQPAAAPQPKIHVVGDGDSLSSIAEAEKLESWRPLWNANTGLENPDLVYAGQQLVVPAGPTEDRPVPVAVQQVAPQPVAQVQTYQQPAYQAPVHRSVTAVPANYSGGSGGIFARIRQRESGGNYSTNTGNGYYGAYQYDNQTWNGYGGYARADLAPAAVQDAKAAQTYAQRGCSPWPNTCY
jgi:LysM repeat protein